MRIAVTIEFSRVLFRQKIDVTKCQRSMWEYHFKQSAVRLQMYIAEQIAQTKRKFKI